MGWALSAAGPCRPFRSQFAAAPQSAADKFFLSGKGCCSSPAAPQRLAHRLRTGSEHGHGQPHPAPRPVSRWRDLNPPPPVVRYERPAPGDLLHLDVKGMTRFSEVSLRGDGRLRGKRKHPGFLALHVAVDDHSRMAFTHMLPDQRAKPTIGFLHEAVAFFARHGIGVRALLTDNGSNYRSQQFRHACLSMAIKHRRTRPYSPQTNGKAERFIQTALREWAYAKHWTNSQE